MANRQCSATERALKLVQAGKTISEAARKAGVDRRTLQRALRRAGK